MFLFYDRNCNGRPQTDAQWYIKDRGNPIDPTRSENLMSSNSGQNCFRDGVVANFLTTSSPLGSKHWGMKEGCIGCEHVPGAGCWSNGWALHNLYL
eukprot:7054101-Prymnesium_polylepis.1